MRRFLIVGVFLRSYGLVMRCHFPSYPAFWFMKFWSTLDPSTGMLYFNMNVALRLSPVVIYSFGNPFSSLSPFSFRRLCAFLFCFFTFVLQILYFSFVVGVACYRFDDIRRRAMGLAVVIVCMIILICHHFLFPG